MLNEWNYLRWTLFVFVSFLRLYRCLPFSYRLLCVPCTRVVSFHNLCITSINSIPIHIFSVPYFYTTYTRQLYVADIRVSEPNLIRAHHTFCSVECSVIGCETFSTKCTILCLRLAHVSGRSFSVQKDESESFEGTGLYCTLRGGLKQELEATDEVNLNIKWEIEITWTDNPNNQQFFIGE